MRCCGAKIQRGERGVGVWRRPDRGYGRISGVCVCGQSICCPVCAPRIAAFRAAEITEAYQRARNAGFEATLDTYTMPHWASSDLGDEIETFGRAWFSLNSARLGMKHRGGYLGNHTAREITFGAVNWWNYHHHQLRYHKPGHHDADGLRASWLACLEGVKRRTDGAEVHAFVSEAVRDEKGATYVSKLATCVDASSHAIGLEVAGSSTKGRNIIRLLADCAAGDAGAGRVWLSGVRAVCERKLSSVRWSPRLREKVGIVATEKSDADVAEEKRERGDELLGELTALQYRSVLRTRTEAALVAAAQSGVEAVNELLHGINAGKLHTDGLPEPTRQPRAFTKPCYT